MTIRNPILRFLAALAVVILAIAVLWGLLYGLGTVGEHWYAAEFPSLYNDDGYDFKATISCGIMLSGFSLGVSWILWAGLNAVRYIGNWLFGPKEQED